VGSLTPLRGMTHLTTCPSGQIVIGGGLSFSIAGLNSAQIARVVINQSAPSGASTWLTRVYNGNIGVTVPVTFWALCVDAP
jgi:hypothetical protein